MYVLKMGYSHKENGINCQDAVGISLDNRVKVVCDGCSEGKHSEVGATLFCDIFTSKYDRFVDLGKKDINVEALIYTVMDELVMIVGDSPETIKDYLSFTILVVEKCDYPDKEYPLHYVYYCGDGFVIMANKNSKLVILDKLDCGEYPEYLAYNYVHKNRMSNYKTGSKVKVFPVYDYDEVGIASDGIRFVADLPQENSLLEEFKNIILEDNSLRMKLFFNKNEKLFQDDFSIVV